MFAYIFVKIGLYRCKQYKYSLEVGYLSKNKKSNYSDILIDE